MLSFLEFLTEARNKQEISTYNDEHAHAEVWNHLVANQHKHGWDLDKMHKIASKLQPSDTGWSGKGERDLDSFEKERTKAVNSIHHLVSTRKEFMKSAHAGHTMHVAGAEKGELSDVTKSFYSKYAKNDKESNSKIRSASTSKTDLTIRNDKGKTVHRLSLKTGDTDTPNSYTSKNKLKGGIMAVRLGKTSSKAKVNRSGVFTMRKAGHVVMSGGPEDTLSTFHHAAANMLGGVDHPEHKEIMKRVHKVADILQSMRNEKVGDVNALRRLSQKAQKHLDDLHSKYPNLHKHVEHEATFGHGRFGSNSPAAPSHVLVTGKI
jgi:hypothetical protein